MVIGERIRQARKALGFTQQQLADSLGIAAASVAQWEIGRTNPSYKSLHAIQEKHGISVLWLQTGDEPMMLPRKIGQGVPVIAWTTVPVVTSGKVSDPASMAIDRSPCPVKHGPRTFVVRMEGDSMVSPTGIGSCPPGCFLYVDPDRKHPKHDKPILATLPSGEVVVGQYMEQAGRSWLRFLNPSYPPYSGDFTVAGVVIFRGEEP